MFRFLLLNLVLALGVFSSATTGATLDEFEMRKAIAERLPGVSPENVRPAPVPGLYEVMVGPIVVYVSADGRYMVRGEIHDMETDRNLTAERVDVARASALKALTDEQMVVFGKDDLPHSVTVFTDVSCAYCRVLHSKMEEYNKRGIQVRYAAFPRNGLASDAWQTMEKVWCAADRQKALTLAKLDREFESRQCNSEAVTEQWQLGRMLGVRGTPAIFTSSGKMIPGYLPPDELARRLKESERP